MEVRRLGDVLLRLRPAPVHSFLAPYLPTISWHSQAQRASLPQRSSIYHQCSRRSFGTGNAAKIAVTPAVSAGQSPEPTGSHTSSRDGSKKVADLLGFIEPRAQRPPPSSQPTSSSIFDSRSSRNQGSSVTDLRDSYYSSRIDRGRVDLNNLIDPKPLASSQANLSERVRSGLASSTPTTPRLRLGPSVGRSVAIEPNRGVDLPRGIKSLEMMCARNQVRGDFMRQRFHERPGLKRKRLRSVRWRKRFREGFRAMVGKVEDMRRRGW